MNSNELSTILLLNLPTRFVIPYYTFNQNYFILKVRFNQTGFQLDM